MDRTVAAADVTANFAVDTAVVVVVTAAFFCCYCCCFCNLSIGCCCCCTVTVSVASFVAAAAVVVASSVFLHAIALSLFETRGILNLLRAFCGHPVSRAISLVYKPQMCAGWHKRKANHSFGISMGSILDTLLKFPLELGQITSLNIIPLKIELLWERFFLTSL